MGQAGLVPEQVMTMRMTQFTGHESRAELVESINKLRAVKASCHREADFRDAIDADVDELLELVGRIDGLRAANA